MEPINIQTNIPEQNFPKENYYRFRDYNKKNDSKCFRKTLWIFQILTWIFLIILIVLSSLITKAYVGPLIIFSIIYIIYIILEQFSSTAKYLRNKNSDESFYQKMLKYFSTPPKISLKCESYHYERYTYTTIDSDGNTSTQTQTQKVITHEETIDFQYYSARDVSGSFYLNCEEALIINKSYIKLELIDEINFADAISYKDYDIAKRALRDRNSDRDTLYDITETRIIPEFISHNLIKLGNTEPCTVNYFFFIIATILTFAELYKLYVNLFCVEQKFKIRKIISTRYDLNQPEFDQKYKNLNPRINLINQKYEFEPKVYNNLNSNYEVNLPSKEELDKAEEFKDKIPDYKVTNDGIIFDNDLKDIYDKIKYVVDLPSAPMGGSEYQPPKA